MAACNTAQALALKKAFTTTNPLTPEEVKNITEYVKTREVDPDKKVIDDILRIITGRRIRAETYNILVRRLATCVHLNLDENIKIWKADSV